MAKKKKIEREKPIKVFGTPEQIAEVKQNIEETEKMLRSGDESRSSSVGYFAHSAKALDVEEVRKSLAVQKATLERITPHKLTGKKANKAYEYAKTLKTWIIEHQPKQTFAMYPRAKDSASKASDFERAVNRQVEWLKHGDKKIQEFHSIMQQVDPSAPPYDFNRHIKEKA